MRRIGVLGSAFAIVTACGGQTASPYGVYDAGPSASALLHDAAAPADAATLPSPSPTSDAGAGARGGIVRDDAGTQDAGETPADGGVCPAGTSLCYCHTQIYCTDDCSLGCGLPPTLPLDPRCTAMGASEECSCYGTLYCGAECATSCDPRPPDSGWCSARYGAVRADEVDATAGTACSGECVLMLELDAAANGQIPVQYGCSQ